MNALATPVTPEFRPMKPEDIDRIILIERAAYPYPWTRGNFVDCLGSGYSCWVLEVADEVVGYSILMAGAGEGHVLNCCVAPAWQGRGLGRLMMQRLIQAAPGYGAEFLFLEVRPSNTRAINLYDSLGFESVGLRKHYYPADQGREDALVMRYGL
ncbi:MAG: ribosomal protein S18-alanine N-acetyltransferase [Parasulfuritortus sp.]|nr:ribosomal protein S18-alanine N-acetyltransferase [Parasulfuritortus sp.]